MARFGINPRGTLGVSIPVLRGLARDIGVDHRLALALWDTEVHEARILASLIADPLQMTPARLEKWVSALDSWDVCDQCCANLFERLPDAPRHATRWARRPEEFVRRAGYVLMARLAVSHQPLPEALFLRYLAFIERHGDDDRNFVRKAVNWAIRQIGKRSPALHRDARECARTFLLHPAGPIRWIGRDALRELESARVRIRGAR
jgi:3-methyladenine DNA glycosylase AlkD